MFIMAHEKRDLIVFRLVFFQMHMQYPIWAKNMLFCLKPHGVNCISANSKDSGVSAVSPEPLPVAYVISTLFSCAG